MNEPIKFGSVCSGIEAASVAWMPLGWRAAWLSEIEPFPSAVLAHHYPDVPNLGDMTALPERIRSGEIEAPDVFCGGTPCQSFSLAGLRKSLDDARGNLSLTFCEIANAIDHVRAGRGDDECVVFWENVPGVLNTRDNAFGSFLAGLAGESESLEPPRGKWTNAGVVFGPQRAVAWRVLDAQYFGVAQRRRRVFVVASARKGFDPAAVLFESEGVRRDIAPRREAGEVAPTIPSRSTADGGLDGGLIRAKQWPADVASTLDTTFGTKQGLEDQHVNSGCPLFVYGIPGNWIGRKPENGGNATAPMLDISPCLTSTDRHGVAAPALAIAFPATLSGTQHASAEDVCPALGAANPTAVACKPMAVRRLLPIECEKLQGFPEVKKNVEIRACLDHQNPSASAETQCLKLPNNARSAEPGASPPSASVAGQSSSTSPPSQSGRVAANVQIDLERMHLHLHNAGRLLLSVSLAEPQSRYPLLTQLGNIAPLLVQVLANLERTTTAGRAASHPHTKPSLHQLNGSPFVELSGQEIGEFANDAETFTKKASAFTKFITSQAGQSFLSCSETLRTLCCFATAAISLCIQEKTNWASSYEISIDLVQGYTAIPWRNKPADQCPDGPRYRALGNSWAIPCVYWIGRRIQHEIAT